MMADHYKRSADDAGVGDAGQGHAKAPRISDALASLDINVVNRLDDLVASGLIAEHDLDAKALGELAQFEPQDALVILEQFEHSGLENVRNKSAYLHGVMVRYRKEPGPRLEQEVNARLDMLFKTSNLKPSDFDPRVYEALGNLPPPVAVRAIDRFQSKVTDEVRNVSAFFTSLLRQEQQNLGSGPGAGHGGYEPGPLNRPPRRQYESYGDQYGEQYGEQYEQPGHADMYSGPPVRSQPGPPQPMMHAPQQQPASMLQLPGLGLSSLLGGVPGQGPQIVVLSPDQLQQLQRPAQDTSALQALLVAALQQQQQQQQQQQAPPQLQILAQPQMSQMPQMLLPTPSFIQPAPVAGKKNYALEHAQMGVRVAEFHGLSRHCEFVHPAPALKLQTLWDGGNRLVSLLDDRTWEALSDLEAPEALAVLDQVVEVMQRKEIRNPNAFFMSVAKLYLEKARLAGGPNRQQRQAGPNRQHQGAAAHQQAAGPMSFGGPRGGGGGPPAQQGQGPRGRNWERPPQRSNGASGGGGGGGGGFESLPDVLQHHAREAIARHHPILSEATFDEGVVDYIKRLDKEDALSVFEELMAADLSNVRNIAAYLMGMIRKRRQEGTAARGR